MLLLAWQSMIHHSWSTHNTERRIKAGTLRHGKLFRIRELNNACLTFGTSSGTNAKAAKKGNKTAHPKSVLSTGITNAKPTRIEYFGMELLLLAS
jgi:hypothetical protein